MTDERVVALLGPSMIFFSENGEASTMLGLQQAALAGAAPQVRWRCEGRILFPGESMARRAEALVEATKPAAVVLVLSAFQFAHESVSLRIRERWPRLYPAARYLMEKVRGLAGGGFEGSRSPRGWLFRLPRQLALWLIGGASDITPEAFLAYSKEALVALSRHEDLIVICRMPVFYWPLSPSQEARAKLKLARVKAELAQHCASGHIPTYDLVDEARGRVELVPAADGVHFSEITRRFEADVIARRLLAAGIVPA